MSELKRRHFEGEIILWVMRWYCRYGISYRDLEQMMDERGDHDVRKPPRVARCWKRSGGRLRTRRWPRAAAALAEVAIVIVYAL